jgi:hypothetical protein
MIAFQPAETFVHSAKWSQVRLWHLADNPAGSADVCLKGKSEVGTGQIGFCL